MLGKLIGRNTPTTGSSTGGAAAPVMEVSPSWELENGDELAPGRTIIKALGGGSRYEVFLVWDERLFALMVAKVIRPHLMDDTRAQGELEAEVTALESLAHPVLVHGYDAVLNGPRPHILLEHLEGPTLRSLIRRHGPLPMEQLLPLAAHIGAVLHYIAGEGWVHLDVKPENIVMGVPPRLIDLSIARTIVSCERIHSPLGTDAYMPPEQCAPKEHAGVIGPASDVWGLGATLFHALTGAVPYPRDRRDRRSPEPELRFPQLASPAPALDKKFPYELRELMASVLDSDPDQRPAASELVTELEPLVAQLPRKLALGRSGPRMRPL